MSKSTNYQIRIKKDMENIIEALSRIENKIRPRDVKDLYCLSKYDPKNQCPRPLLVKLLHSNMALDSKLETYAYIKPDMTHQEHQKELLLLKERKSLIDQGTE